MVSGHAPPGTNVEVRKMALESVHACDCSNGFTYVGTISVGKVSGGVGATHAAEELALSNYFVIATKTLVDHSWVKEAGEDNKEHLKYVPFAGIAGSLYCRLRDHGTLNKKMVKLPNIIANHELDI
jgi:hypothetical protein